MFEEKNFSIKCRAIIIHEEKLLLVKHAHDASVTALPGGHLEWGEGVIACLEREIIEELGVKPTIGRLLYINTYMDGENVQPLEFFFEVTNGADFAHKDHSDSSHAHELAEVLWIAPGEDVKLRPHRLAQDFKNGLVLSDTVRFIDPQ